MRILIIVGFVLCSIGMYADNEQDSIKADKDPYYLQLYIGINKSANENLPWTEFSGYPWSTGMFVGIGREVNPLLGWRAAFRFNRNKSRNVPECESKDVWGWNNTALFGDVTFDVTDAFHKPRYIRLDSLPRVHSSRFNLKAFAGVGVAYTWNFDDVPLSYIHPYSRSSKLIPALRAGVTATWKLSDQWRIGAELSQTLYEDHFNGVAYDAPLDTRTNLKVGLTYLFVKKQRVTKPVIRLNKLRECPPLPFMMPDPEETKLRQIAGHAFLDFPVNETVIYPEYRRNPEELARIKKSVDSALFDKTVVVTRISLHGYASPESPYSNNTRLAKGRTEALKNYLIRNYNFNTQVFQTNYTPEDWENLRGFLIDSKTRKVKGDFWYESKDIVETPETPDYVLNHRDEMLRIIGRSMDPDAKEELLKKVGGGEPYRWLLEHVYPGLRHTDYIIEYKVRAFSVEKGRKLIYTHPEALSLEEMYKVATSYKEGSENWLDALLIAVEQFPDDETANLNAACGCVMTKRLVDAKKYLQKAGTSRQAKYVGNVIKAMEGNVNWKIQNGRVVVIEE
ncbi:MAG: hypothetical protein IKZ48_03620 [Prevotella sp.]|nr:hypothetical protein [Prevotella sp.]